MHNRPIFAVFAIAAVALAATPADAKQCFKKAGIGEASTADGAKFQVDEALLQATDWSPVPALASTCSRVCSRFDFRDQSHEPPSPIDFLVRSTRREV
jgi:hypothetical protein